LTFTGNLTSQTTVTSASLDPNPMCSQCVDTDILGIGADIIIVNTDNQVNYILGGINVYTITVHNNGPSYAINVVVTNAIPTGITQFSWTGSNGSIGTNTALNNTIPLLTVGQTITYTVTLQVPLTFTGNLSSETIVTSDTIDPNPLCAQCIDTDIPVINADIVVVNSDNQVGYILGSTNVYTVTVHNNGPSSATNVLVTNAIPAGITQFSWIGSNGSSGTNTALSNTTPTLVNGQTVTYTIALQVPLTFTGNLVSTANATSTTPDPIPTCLQCVDTDIAGANIVVTNTNSQTCYTAGTTVVYSVTVTNNGPISASNIQVTNAIPSGITQFSWTGSNGTSGSNILLNDFITTLTSGQTISYTIGEFYKLKI
jgi:uncharacterized repeat protein (TIGR01451 family)